MMRRPESVIFAAAVILIALGYLAVLPPFEGFDETAHYSSIQQIADTKTIPRYGKSFLSLTVEDYRLHGPSPYASLHPPFDQNNGITYADFFSSPERAAVYQNLYRRPSAAGLYRPGKTTNWQAQHPPLYYLLMAPLLTVTASVPLVTQLLVLRLASFLMAFAGLLIAWHATMTHWQPPGKKTAACGFMLYPLIVPMFFAEFARLGNDSLCLLLFGMVWALLCRFDGKTSNRHALFLGILLGLGLLTKAFFLAIAAGVVLFLLWRLRRKGCQREPKTVVCKQLVFVAAPVLMIGGGWYISNWLAYGSLVGSDEFIALSRQGGLWINLKDKLTIFAFVRGISATLASWLWAGSWSLARVNELFRIPLVALICWLTLRYLFQIWRRPLSEPVWLPVWLAAPFFAGLVYHIFAAIALTGSGGTGGWYLHVLGPVFAVMFAVGLEGMTHWSRRLLTGLAAYAVFFLIAVQWLQMAMFAGLAVKGPDKYYQFKMVDLMRAGDILARLDVLGWPVAGLICFTAGLFLLVFSLKRTIDALS